MKLLPLFFDVFIVIFLMPAYDNSKSLEKEINPKDKTIRVAELEIDFLYFERRGKGLY